MHKSGVGKANSFSCVENLIRFLEIEYWLVTNPVVLERSTSIVLFFCLLLVPIKVKNGFVSHA